MRHPDPGLLSAFIVEILREQMKLKKVSQKEMSVLTGISRNSLNRKLNGLTPLRVGETAVMCEVLEISICAVAGSAEQMALDYMDSRYTPMEVAG